MKFIVILLCLFAFACGSSPSNAPQSSPDGGLNGATGTAGPIGATGPAGAIGPTGEKGDKGDPGPAGPAGTDGKNGANGISGAVGPMGPAGIPGSVGPTGPANVSSVVLMTTVACKLQWTRTLSPTQYEQNWYAELTDANLKGASNLQIATTMRCGVIPDVSVVTTGDCSAEVQTPCTVEPGAPDPRITPLCVSTGGPDLYDATHLVIGCGTVLVTDGVISSGSHGKTVTFSYQITSGA